jgi:hypothetical protein
MRRLFASALLSFAVFAFVLPPHAARAEEATATVERYMAAWKADGLASTASFFDPAGVTEIAGLMRPLLEMNDTNKANPLREGLRGAEFTAEDAGKLGDTEVFSMILQMTEGAMQKQGGASLENYKVLGSVPENDDLAHVVARSTMKYRENEVDQVNLITVKKADGKWTIAMRPELKQMLGSLRQQMVAGMARQAQQQGGAPQ